MIDPRIDRLVVLAGLIRDHRLVRHAAAVRRRDETIALRDGLEPRTTDDPAAWQAQTVHAVWVERQRDILASRIRHETTAAETEAAGARIAFARAQVLERVLERVRGQLS